MEKKDVNVVMVLGITQHILIERQKMAGNIQTGIFATAIQSTAYNSDYLPPLQRLHCLMATSDNRKRYMQFLGAKTINATKVAEREI